MIVPLSGEANMDLAIAAIHLEDSKDVRWLSKRMQLRLLSVNSNSV